MEKALEKELEKMEMEYHIHVIREDLKGDRLQSAKLVKAAYESNWKEVETLLEQGADPKICRYGDAIDKKSALYFAMVAEQFDLAEKLYDAGDRLDDVIPDEDEKIPARALHFLSHEMRWGKNYFYDPGKPLSECCRCSAFEQIADLMETASQEELNKSIGITVSSWCHYFHNSVTYADIIEGLLAHGATLTTTEKHEILDLIERRFYRHCPMVLRPDESDIQKIVALIRKA